MWLITSFGFFSVVRKPADVKGDTLTVRARAAADLDALRMRYLPELGPIARSKGTDYRYRASAPRAAVGRAMARAIGELDYSNFKDEVAARQGSRRAGLYHDVWSVLMKLQSDEAAYASGVGTGRASATIAQADTYGGVLIDGAGSRILLREPANHFGGYVWTFPKGGPDHGETPAQTALREVREETGHAAEIVGALPGTFKGSTSTTAAFFVMRPVGKPQGATPETASIQWVTLVEARKLVSLSTTKSGRARDLAVIDAVEEWLRGTRG